MAYNKDELLGQLIRRYDEIIREMAVLSDSIRETARNADFAVENLKRGALELVAVRDGVLVSQSSKLDWTDLAEKLAQWHELKVEKDAKDECLRSAGLEHIARR